MFKSGNLSSLVEMLFSFSCWGAISGNLSLAHLETIWLISLVCCIFFLSSPNSLFRTSILTISSISFREGALFIFKTLSTDACTAFPNSRLSTFGSGSPSKFRKYHFHGHSKKLFKSETETYLSEYFSATSFDKEARRVRSELAASFLLLLNFCFLKISAGKSTIALATSCSPAFSDPKAYERVQNLLARVMAT